MATIVRQRPRQLRFFFSKEFKPDSFNGGSGGGGWCGGRRKIKFLRSNFFLPPPSSLPSITSLPFSVAQHLSSIHSHLSYPSLSLASFYQIIFSAQSSRTWFPDIIAWKKKDSTGSWSFSCDVTCLMFSLPLLARQGEKLK